MSWFLHGNAALALLAAVSWGGGDFSGGMGVKRAGGSMVGALRVILVAHVLSLAVLAVFALSRGDAFPQGAPLAWGLGSGIAAGISLALFYIALSRGAMGASAAVSGLLAAAIPALVSSLSEGTPHPRQFAGFVIAGIAIWLIAAGPEPAAKGTMLLATIAGTGFGIYFVALKYAGVAGVAWPMATARMGSIATCAVMLCAFSLLALGEKPVPFNRSILFWAFATALLDTGGNLLFLAATRAGRLDVAAVLASLYPATTILLAALTLGERPTRRQATGMFTAAAAVVFITL